jgi:Holliday junction resolvase
MLKEQQIQAKLIKELEQQGYYVIKLVKTNKNGIPDLIAIPKNSDVEFFEVKRHDGKVSPLQEFRIKELNNHGVKAVVFRGPKETKDAK